MNSCLYVANEILSTQCSCILTLIYKCTTCLMAHVHKYLLMIMIAVGKSIAAYKGLKCLDYLTEYVWKVKERRKIHGQPQTCSHTIYAWTLTGVCQAVMYFLLAISSVCIHRILEYHLGIRTYTLFQN